MSERSEIHLLYSLLISAIHTVSQGHQLVAEGWAAFEKTCNEVGAGELPQLLRYVKTATTPTPTPTPTKFETKERKVVKNPLQQLLLMCRKLVELLRSPST